MYFTKKKRNVFMWPSASERKSIKISYLFAFIFADVKEDREKFFLRNCNVLELRSVQIREIECEYM